MTKQSYAKVMEKFKLLPYLEQQLIRRAASDELRGYGFQEIGTSDINHGIVNLYNSYGSFETFLDSKLELLQETNYIEL